VILVIDNYDSFTYNLVQALYELGREVTVVRNDAARVDELLAREPEAIIISPGPGNPDEAGVSLPLIRAAAGRFPILGVCLGHQCLGQAFGGRIVRARRLMHGRTSSIRHDGRTIFSGLPNPITATRYHSLAVERESLPDCFEVSATSEEGEIMAIRHRQLRLEGVQFHPESIMTPLGKRILNNFLTGEERMLPIKEAIDRLISGEDLAEAEAEDVMELIMSGEATPSQISAILTSLRLKGETVDEITGFARVMRRNVRPIRRPEGMVVDTCGTGGDRSGTFNISTAAAFVVAGAGVTVAKHGNRAVSGKAGSADVLEALGVNIAAPLAVAERALAEVGIAFLFAPAFHPAMKHAVGPRREIGIRTVFNILGPLSNPVGADAQVLGVYDPFLTETMALVLKRLGSRHALVVHGQDGLDEITLTCETRISELKDGFVDTYLLRPEEVGLARCRPADLAGGDARENAAILRRVLEGEAGPRRDVVLLNAAAALLAGGAAADLRGGLALAANSVDQGLALGKLTALAALTSGGARG
jgi:anthranilate synthase/phosphoribosyltransferase